MKKSFLPRYRLWIALIMVVGFWGLAVGRLVQVQIFKHEQAATLTQRQAEGWINIPAARGLIRDMHGRLLATNSPRTSFVAVPKKWVTRSERQRAARRLARISGRSRAQWLKRFEKSPEFIYVARAVSSKVADRIRGWKDAAIIEILEPGRMYPAGRLGRELLGGVDIDNHGSSGIELAFNEELSDHPARGRVRLDARRSVYIDPLPSSLASDGHELSLTIDWSWQEIVEDELAKVVSRTRAKGGGAILMTPEGAIRALAYYDGPEAPKSTSNHLRCRPITDLFEPGSIFKSMTAAAMLASGVVTFTDSVYADSGEAYFSGRRIRDSEPHLWMDFPESFVLSSNIAFGKWAQRMSGDQWYRWLRNFGFGEPTRVGLSAEPRGLIPHFKNWTALSKAQLAMGHSVAVTPLQILSAFAVFANGGNLQRPYIVKTIVNAHGDTLVVGRPQRIRHLFGSEVVEPMRELLSRVVTEGTATAAMSKAIAIAGKTGTAQKVKASGGGYYQNKYVASFVGFFPADAPKVVGIVYLDEPRTNHFGGWTAGPAFTRMAERLAVQHPEFLRYPEFETLHAIPADLPDPRLTPGITPDLVGLPLSRAVACASHLGYEVNALGSGAVVSQQPQPGQSFQAGGILILQGTPQSRVAVERGKHSGTDHR